MPARKTRQRPATKTFGERLRDARVAAGLSPVDLAKQLGVGLSTYYSWESNARTPRDLPAVAAAVHSTVGALFGESAAA